MTDNDPADDMADDETPDDEAAAAGSTSTADSGLLFDDQPPPDDDAPDDETPIFVPADVQVLDKARVSPASAEELAKIGRVYVLPPRFDEAARVLAEFRLVHLAGPDHAGKFALAHRLALGLEATLHIRLLRCTEDATILDLFQDSACPPQSVFIMRDAFISPGLNKPDFDRNVSALLEILHGHNQFLILTADDDAGEANRLGDGRQTVAVSPPPASGHDELLRRHFDYYSIPDSWLGLAARARQSLEYPYHFDLFAARLQRMETRPTPSRLEIVARDIKDSALSVRLWFNGLNPNQRYFAMLACLCPGLSLDDLWQVYVKLIAFLKGQGIRLDAPLNYGREDLLESIQARRTAAGTVEFNSAIFAQGALAQAQQNYREQFRLLLPRFVEAIETAAAGGRPEARDRRQAMTTAIGLLGQADLRWVRPHLLTLAKNEMQDVRVAAAAALRRICDVEEQQQPVANLLAGWARDKRWLVRWTAAAAYGKLPRAMSERSLEVLGTLAGDRSKSVRDEVDYVLAPLFRRAPNEVTATLNGWPAGDNPVVGSTLRKAVVRIARDPRVQTDYFRQPAQQDAFWPLLDHVIRRGQSEQVNATLALLRAWLERERDNAHSEMLEEMLLATAGRLGRERHKLVRDTLDKWAADADAAPVTSPFYMAAPRLATAMAYIQPVLAIDETDLIEEEILVIDEADLGELGGIVWVD